MLSELELLQKIEKLREEWKNAPESERKLLAIRGKLLKRQLEELQKKEPQGKLIDS